MTAGNLDLDAWLERLETLHPKVVDLGLERISAVLERLELGSPGYRVITVGGTNGKGSTVAMLERLLKTGGSKVGALTSPHLWRFNERVRIDGRMATDEELGSWFEAVESARSAASLTFFEFTTAAALWGFGRCGVEIAVLEVGLGGRLDAVNAIDPDVAVVTSIALDHQNWLGETRAEIGFEKAGIFRAHRPCIVGDPEPPETLLAHARALRAQMFRYGPDFRVSRGKDGLDYQGIAARRLALPETAITGNVDGRNLGCALAALECLGTQALPDSKTIREALADLQVPGRFQRVDVDQTEWILDVAHNPAAAANLARQLRREPVRRTFAVIGMLEDKDTEGVARALRDVVHCWVAVPIDRPRGQDETRLAQRLKDGGAKRVREANSVTRACDDLRSEVGKGDRVIVLGSFYVVAPAGEALGLYCAPPRSA